MITKIQKWGNSLGVRIPKNIVQAEELHDGMQVEIGHAEEGIILRPVKTRKYQLGALLKKVSKKNLHEAVDTGEPQGRESW